MIRHQLSDKAVIFDLLRTDLYLELSVSPHLLERLLTEDANQRLIIIDEVQRIPMLLNEVHRLIEEKRLTFLLTGSNARRLKRQHVNLLAGRAWEANLFPLTYHELGEKFDLDRYLLFGDLPAVYLSQDPKEELLDF